MARSILTPGILACTSTVDAGNQTRRAQLDAVVAATATSDTPFMAELVSLESGAWPRYLRDARSPMVARADRWTQTRMFAHFDFAAGQAAVFTILIESSKETSRGAAC